MHFLWSRFETMYCEKHYANKPELKYAVWEKAHILINGIPVRLRQNLRPQAFCACTCIRLQANTNASNKQFLVELSLSIHCLLLPITDVGIKLPVTAAVGSSIYTKQSYKGNGKSWLHAQWKSFKGTVHPNMKITVIYLPSNHPRCIWFSAFRLIQSELYIYKKNVLALPSYIINEGWNFEGHKSTSIYHKKYSSQLWAVNKGLLMWSNAFVNERVVFPQKT